MSDVFYTMSITLVRFLLRYLPTPKSGVLIECSLIKHHFLFLLILVEEKVNGQWTLGWPLFATIYFKPGTWGVVICGCMYSSLSCGRFEYTYHSLGSMFETYFQTEIFFQVWIKFSNHKNVFEISNKLNVFSRDRSFGH